MRMTMMTAVVCLGAAMGFGQSMQMIHVTLPVAAKVGNTYLPAGSYSIHEVSSNVIEISSDARQGVSAFATVNQIDAPKHSDHTTVTLRSDGRDYQVDKIYIEGQELGFELTTGAE